MMRWWSGVCLVLILGAAAHSAGDSTPWWKTAVLYQIYPRSFMDSDGDGVGDLKGIIQMADYLKELGVDAVWLSPIYTSPMVDFGYDISNFKDIDPLFGTMDDFDALVAKFRKLGLKLLMDFVPNHTSDKHPWFKKSVKNDKDYRDFYIWQNPKYSENGTRLPPNNWISVFSGSAWEWNEERQKYYLHQFATQQPDLNYRNPNVWGNMTDVLKFWLDKGVDGFRMDAVGHIYEDGRFLDEPPVPGTPGNTYPTLQHIYIVNQPETLNLLRYWADVVYDRVQQDKRDRMVILEVYEETPLAMKYYGSGKESLEFPFNFRLLEYGNQSTRPATYKYLIDDWVTHLPDGGVSSWAVGNHDQKRVADRFGPEMVDAINMLTGVLPGIKVTYNGEEIGMRDTFIRWDQTVDPAGRNLGPEHYMDETGSRDPVRTPMQWNNSTSAGFSTNRKTWLPVNPNYWWLNVEAQRKAEESHFKVFQTLLQARKDPVLQKGDLRVIVPDNDTLLVDRSYGGTHFVLIINMGSELRDYTSQNLLAQYSLDRNMTVVVASINSGYKSGHYFQNGSLNVMLRPKAAVLLTTGSWKPTPSSGSRLLLSFFLLLICTLATLLRL